MTADWGQFCRFSGLKCGPKLVGMFNTFIGTKFNVFGTFENFDLMGLVLTKGVICIIAAHFSDVTPGVSVRPSPDGVCDAFRWLGPGPPSVTDD